MKKIDLGQTIMIIANVGVIAGIVFLGIELRRNNELMQSQIRANFQGARLHVNSMIADSQWIPKIYAKVEAGELLAPDEAIRLQAAHQVILTVAQWMYGDFIALGLEPPAGRMRAVFNGVALTPRIGETWESYKLTVTPEFAAWMDENVVNER